MLTLFVLGVWHLIGDFVIREIPDGAPTMSTTLVPGRPCKAIAIRSDGTLERIAVAEKFPEALWTGVESPDRRFKAYSLGTFLPAGTMSYTAVQKAGQKDPVVLRHPAIKMTAGAWCEDRLVTGGVGGYLGIFDVETGRRLWKLTGHGTAEIVQIAVSGGTIYSLDDNGQVRMATLK